MSAAGALSPEGCEMYHAAASDQSGTAGMKVSVPPLPVRQDDTVSEEAAASAKRTAAAAMDLLEEYIRTLDKLDVLGNACGVDAVEVGLEGGGDAAVLGAELGGEGYVTIALGGQDEVGPGVDGGLGLLEVDLIEALGVAELKHIILALPWEEAAPKRTERRMPAM